MIRIIVKEQNPARLQVVSTDKTLHIHVDRRCGEGNADIVFVTETWGEDGCCCVERLASITVRAYQASALMNLVTRRLMAAGTAEMILLDVPEMVYEYNDLLDQNVEDCDIHGYTEPHPRERRETADRKAAEQRRAKKATLREAAGILPGTDTVVVLTPVPA